MMGRDDLMKVVHQLEKVITENAATRADAENIAWLLHEEIRKKNAQAKESFEENSLYEIQV